MIEIKLILSLIAKAILTGLGLAFGFWLVGKATGYIDFYIAQALHNPEQLRKTVKKNGINILPWLRCEIVEKAEDIEKPNKAEKLPRFLPN